MAIKRVACLYRVSTKGQVDKNDIPMQKDECHSFIKTHSDWALVEEYYEKGVSGYKKTASERDVLQQIKQDALSKKFNVLLVFMFDRLGRIEDETPFVLEWFTKQGIEMWSTQEGQQKFTQHSDKLINYLRFWQANGESEKTSIRVDASHTQMTIKGQFRGGSAPYGYKLERSGEYNKKGKELYKLTIDETESETIKEIYSLALLNQFGQQRIAGRLNEKEILTRSCSMWNSGTIGYILKNPIYMGYPAYKKKTTKSRSAHNLPPSEWILPSEQQTDLVIIEKETWESVQQIRKENGKIKNSHLNIGKTPLLFVGIIYCGSCGSPMTTTYSYVYGKTDNDIKVIPKYRCSGKTTKKTQCKGQTTYSAKRIEDAVLNQVYLFLENIREFPQVKQDSELKFLEKQSKNYMIKINKAEKEINVLTNEISNSLLGESKFSPEILSKLIDEKILALDNSKEEFNRIKTDIARHKTAEISYDKLNDVLDRWTEIWDTFEFDRKKALLRKLINKIILYSNDNIYIEFNAVAANFIDGIA